jgi:hypothetical protein
VIVLSIKANRKCSNHDSVRRCLVEWAVHWAEEAVIIVAIPMVPIPNEFRIWMLQHWTAGRAANKRINL